ncbi:MAG: DUF308 domain-containing protein [Methanomassiliicoccus sp.]|nr:DUF308 domain-containing protein [Methanomassiliicoccus sp.]
MEFASLIGDWRGRFAVGVIAAIFGLMFLIVPEFTLTVFLFVFGALMILSGIVLLVFSKDKTSGKNWRMLNMIEGVFAILIGIIAIVAPGFTALWAIYLVGFFAIFSGIFQIAEGLAAPKTSTTMAVPNRWLLVISGVWSLIIGFLFVLFPGSGILALMWLVGLFLIVAGALNIVAGMKLRAGTAPASKA